MIDNSNMPLAHQHPQKVGKKILLSLLFLILVFVGIVAVNISKTIGLNNFYSFINNFVNAPIGKLANQNGRTNILVMGIGGKDHEGGDLTDTMIFVSLGLTKPEIVMISIPRDIWIPTIRAKVNSAYHYGGLTMAKNSVQEVLGVPVNYGVVLDFSAFKDIVDLLGGVSVNVEHSFIDPLYPIAGRENDLCNGDKLFKCRYESITFSEGDQIMNGETALKFVRSRHAEGDEGTDLAREARQQKVISAIENKIMDPKVFLNINKDFEIWKTVTKSMETDINIDSAAVLARKTLSAISLVNKYLIPESLLVNPPISAKYDKQYVFVPKAGNGNWKDVNEWTASLLP